MEKLLCESIVYCDFVLIILFIVGVLIHNKALVCLFVLSERPSVHCPTACMASQSTSSTEVYYRDDVIRNTLIIFNQKYC